MDSCGHFSIVLDTERVEYALLYIRDFIVGNLFNEELS